MGKSLLARTFSLIVKVLINLRHLAYSISVEHFFPASTSLGYDGLCFAIQN